MLLARVLKGFLFFCLAFLIRRVLSFSYHRRTFRNSVNLSATSTPRCPPEEEMMPCVCILSGTELQIRCKNSDVQKIRKSLQALKGTSSVIKEFTLLANRIPSIPHRFFGSLQIKNLFLMDNEMVSLSRNAFDGLEGSLSNIYIRENLLEDVSYDVFDNLRELRTILIEDTSLLRIPRLYSLPHLEIIKIISSRVTNVHSDSFRAMPSLRKIQVTKSHIKQLDDKSLEGLIYLKEIDFSDNSIKWVHPGAFRNLEMMEFVNLESNRIEDAAAVVMAAREMRLLKVLNLARNDIRFLNQGTFVDLPNLEEVNLSHNKIKVIGHESIFKLPKLRKLILNNNIIHHCEIEAFVDVPSFENLDLGHNNLSSADNIRTLYDSLPNLKYLDLNSNHIKGGTENLLGGHMKLQTLILNENFITPLHKGIFRSLPNLQKLYLSQNHIKRDKEFQIWDLPKLQLLDMSQNSLTVIDGNLLMGLPSLTDFILNFNFISELSSKSFHSTPELKSLNISYNKITKIDYGALQSVPHLYEIDLSFNGLTSLNSDLLRGLSSLEILRLTNNQIRGVDTTAFRDTVKLKTLDFSNNLLEHIPSDAIRDLTSLKKLCFRQNAIKDIRSNTFQQLRIIERMDLSFNYIQTIHSNAFAEMNVLKDLDLSTNYIQSLPSNLFDDMKLVEKLNISNNFVISLVEGTFKSTKQLRILDLTNNSLTSISESIHDLPSLQGLFLKQNYINELTNRTFINLPSLSVLFFGNNGLQSIEVGTLYNLSSLSYLDLRHNNLDKIKSYSFSSLKSLSQVQLSHNQIVIIEDYAFLNLPSLQSLELQENMISSIGKYSFDKIPSLKFLNLSQNMLKDIPHQALSKVPNVDVLDLSWNYIYEITDYSLRDLRWLTVLLLHHNDICYLSDGSFRSPRSLRVLMLHNNQLKSLHLNALQGPIASLSLLDMGGNPFICNCELIWLKEYLLMEEDRQVSNNHRFSTGHRNSYLYQSGANGFPGSAGFGSSRNLIPAFPSPIRGQPVCAGPPEYAGTPITEVPPEAFLCARSSDDPKEQEKKCISRFMNQQLPGSNTSENELTPEMLNSLMKLSNLSDVPPELAPQLSSIDYKNPIVISSLSELIDNYSQQNDTIIPSEELKNPNLKKITNINLQNSDFVTGDTPTIYAGSASFSDEGEPQKTSGDLFGLPFPNVPNFWEALSNFKLPDLGINLDWSGMPFLRHSDGSTPTEKELEQILQYLQLYKNLENSNSLQVNAQPDKKINTQNDESKKLQSKHLLSGRSNSSNVAKFNSIFSHPQPNFEIYRNTSFNQLEPDDYDANIYEEVYPDNQYTLDAEIPNPVPNLPTMLSSGPGPNSGTPFLPGLYSKSSLSDIKANSPEKLNPKLDVEYLTNNTRNSVYQNSNTFDERAYQNWAPPRNNFLPGLGNFDPSPYSGGNNPQNPIIEVSSPDYLWKTPYKLDENTTNFISNDNSFHSNINFTNYEILDKEELNRLSDSQYGLKINPNTNLMSTESTPTTNPYDHWTKSFVSLKESSKETILETTKAFELSIGKSNNLPEINIKTSARPDITKYYVPVSLLPTTEVPRTTSTDNASQSYKISQQTSTESEFSKLIDSFTTPATTKDNPSATNHNPPNISSQERDRIDNEDYVDESYANKWWPPLDLGKGVSLVKETTTPETNEEDHSINTTKTETKHVSPSRSVSLNSALSFKEKEDNEIQHIQEVKPPSLVEKLSETYENVQIITSPPNRVSNMDWYYSNYHKIYNSDRPLPVGGNLPSASGVFELKISFIWMNLACILLIIL